MICVSKLPTLRDLGPRPNNRERPGGGSHGGPRHDTLGHLARVLRGEQLPALVLTTSDANHPLLDELPDEVQVMHLEPESDRPRAAPYQA